MAETEAINSIDLVLDDALRRARSGQPLDVEQYCSDFPDFAEDLRVMLPALLLLEPSSQQPSAAPESGPPASLADFRIVRELGRGAMGVVYEAIQQSLGRRVALKVFRPSAADSGQQPARFRREAETAARLHHSNIIPVFDSGESDGCCYFAMQLIDGINLQQLLAGKPSSALPPQELPGTAGPPADQSAETTALAGSTEKEAELAGGAAAVSLVAGGMQDPRICARIALQVAEGLAFAHQQGILHRDIKPSNIMLDREGRAWIADFGLARPEEGENLTATGDVVGTLRYLAPESFSGQTGPRSDVYSLGLTLFELLEGRPAWLSGDRAGLIHQILHGTPPRLERSRRAAGPDLARIVAKSTARESSDRYQSAGELASDLRLYLEGQPVRARRLTVMEQLWRWTRRNPLVASLLGTIALLLVGGLATVSFLLVRSREQTRIADENFRTALETVKTYLTTVSESPELKTRGAENLRRELLTAARTYYEGFARRYKDNERLHQELADAQFMLGAIHEDLGEIPESIQCFERARVMLESGNAIEDGSEEAGLLSRLLQNLGNNHRQLGNWEAARRCLVEARQLAGQSLARHPDQLDHLLELANIESQLGKVLGNMHRAEEELASCEHAEELLARVPKDDECPADLVAELCSLHKNLGAIRRKQGLLEKAGGHFRAMLTLSQRLAAVQPELAEHQASQAVGHVNLGELALIDGSLTIAREHLTAAAGLLEALAERHPSVVSHREGLVACRINLGMVDLAENRFDAAGQSFQVALRTQSRLLEDSPEAIGFRFTRAQILANLGAVAHRQGDAPSALDFSQQAFEDMQLLVTQDPDNPEFAETQFGMGANVAAMLNAAGQPAEGLEILLESIRGLEQLVQRRPELPSVRIALAQAHANAAAASCGLGDPHARLAHYEQAIRLLEQLHDEHESNPEVTSLLAADLDWAAQAHYQAGRSELAADMFRKAVALRAELLRQQPDNPAHLQAVAFAQFNLAMTLRDLGEAEDSLPHFDEAVRQLVVAFESGLPRESASVGNFRLERSKAVCRLERFREAIADCRRAITDDPQADRDCAQAVIAHALAASGKFEEAISTAKELAETSFGDPRDTIELAAAWALLGKAAAEGQTLSLDGAAGTPLLAEECWLQAIGLIETAVVQGFHNTSVLDSNPSLDPLRDRADYQALLARMATGEH